MSNNKNIILAKQMMELIAERTGEDRGDVFLDIIIHQMIFRNRSSIWSQQIALNQIAEEYNIKTPILKQIKNNEEEVPF
jgi:hypothetical protein